MNYKIIKSIPNFPGYYITKSGKVFSGLKILKLQIQTNGYLFVTLQKDGRSFQKRVHRLVLETFVGLCPEGMECRHLNGVKYDNRLENLCWGTHKENGLDRIRHKNMSWECFIS